MNDVAITGICDVHDKDMSKRSQAMHHVSMPNSHAPLSGFYIPISEHPGYVCVSMSVCMSVFVCMCVWCVQGCVSVSL